jgi:hypothetical protein
MINGVFKHDYVDVMGIQGPVIGSTPRGRSSIAVLMYPVGLFCRRTTRSITVLVLPCPRTIDEAVSIVDLSDDASGHAPAPARYPALLSQSGTINLDVGSSRTSGQPSFPGVSRQIMSWLRHVLAITDSTSLSYHSRTCTSNSAFFESLAATSLENLWKRNRAVVSISKHRV